MLASNGMERFPTQKTVIVTWSLVVYYNGSKDYMSINNYNMSMVYYQGLSAEICRWALNNSYGVIKERFNESSNSWIDSLGMSIIYIVI